MEREIKFRGKSKRTGKWIFGNIQIPTPPFDEYFICHDGQEEISKETIGQYTGLKDRLRVDIYDGDVLSENGNIIGVVVWSARYGVSIRKKNTTWSLINFCLDSDFGSGILSDIEIVGNIYDNPELG